MKEIICKFCHKTLTSELEELGDDFKQEYEDAQDVVPKGYFTIGDDCYSRNTESTFIVNIADLIGTKYHPDKKRLNGCCGYSDSEGPNLICQCGIELGSEMSDCWVPRMAYLSPKSTEVIDVNKPEVSIPLRAPRSTP